MALYVGDSEILVPENSRVVHIGPSKTGTTSIQWALHLARDEMARQGVRVASKKRHPWQAARAAANMKSPRYNNEVPPMSAWQDLVKRIDNATEPRTVISSEYLAHSGTPAIERIVDSLGREETQVVITLRPLAKILPSQWQQGIQIGGTKQFDEWLADAFDFKPVMRPLWHRHRHDELIARWAEVAGPDHVTVVVVNDADHAGILRSFEHLLGLKPETLQSYHDRSNRSLTRGEIEIMRELNLALKNTTLGGADRIKLLEHGALPYLKQMQPQADEEKVLMPQWALDRAAAMTEQIIAGIEQLNVKVSGDLDLLRNQPVSRESTDFSGPEVVPSRTAARFAMGILKSGDLVTEVPKENSSAVKGNKNAATQDTQKARDNTKNKGKKQGSRVRRAAARVLGGTGRRLTRWATRL